MSREVRATGYGTKRTHSFRLSRDVTFDESCFPSLQSDEPRPAPASPAHFPAQAPVIQSPVHAVPNPPATPPPVVPPSDPPGQPPVRSPSPAQSADSEARVISMLQPPDTEEHAPDPADTTQPSTPSPTPSTLTPVPSTPEQPSVTPSTPPPRRRNTRIADRPPLPLADPPGGLADRAQRAALLREMAAAAAPRRSARAPCAKPALFWPG